MIYVVGTIHFTSVICFVPSKSSEIAMLLALKPRIEGLRRDINTKNLYLEIWLAFYDFAWCNYTMAGTAFVEEGQEGKGREKAACKNGGTAIRQGHRDFLRMHVKLQQTVIGNGMILVDNSRHVFFLFFTLLQPSCFIISSPLFFYFLFSSAT